MPAREIGVVAARDRQHLVEGAKARALAEPRRDDVIDDAVVEGVAGNADAGVSERLGAQMPARPREAHYREIAGAATEIGNQHGRVPLQAPSEGEGSADGLVDIARVASADVLERGAVALHRQRLVGISAGEAHGTADRDGGGLEAELLAAMARQRAQ